MKLVPAGAVAPLPAFLPSNAPYWVKVIPVPLAPNYHEMYIDAYKRYKNYVHKKFMLDRTGTVINMLLNIQFI
jgi:hypothetical protein